MVQGEGVPASAEAVWPAMMLGPECTLGPGRHPEVPGVTSVIKSMSWQEMAMAGCVFTVTSIGSQA